MILDTLARADRYAALHPGFARAFAFLRGAGLDALAPGRHPIDGDALFAIVEHCEARARDTAKLECHRRYIDIQLVLEGIDEMGWRPLADCADPATAHDAARDIRFFNDTPAAWVATPPGAFCVFFPDDAHAPLTGTGRIRKIVVKVAV